MTREVERGSKVVVALAAAALGYGLMQSFITPLLPSLAQRSGVTAATAAWLVTGFLLSACVATPVVGRLGDMFGRTRMLRIVVVFFAVGTAMLAAAPTFEVLLAARVVQGLGGAIFPLAFGIIRERLAQDRVAGAIGVLSSMIAVGSGLGIVAAGPIVAVFDHHAVFLVAALAAAAAATLVFLWVPVDSPGTSGRVDWAGAALMVVWLGGLLLLVTNGVTWGWGVETAVTTVTMLVAFAGWLAVERRATVPIINLRLMASPPVATANLLAFLFGYLLFAPMVVLPAFVQTPAEAGYGFGASIAGSALFLLPQTVLFFVTSLLASPLSRWPGSRAVIVAGSIATAAGSLLLAVSSARPIDVLVAASLTGLGVGLIYSHLASLLVQVVPPGEVGSATGMNTNVRNIGGAIGAQVSAVAVATVGGAAGYHLAFGMLAAVAVGAIPVAVAMLMATRRGGG